MKNYCGDFLIAVSFIAGVAAFISGEFIMSTILFATAALTSNVYRNELESVNRIKKPDA